jgi:hypothetical protein
MFDEQEDGVELSRSIVARIEFSIYSGKRHKTSRRVMNDLMCSGYSLLSNNMLTGRSFSYFIIQGRNQVIDFDVSKTA